MRERDSWQLRDTFCDNVHTTSFRHSRRQIRLIVEWLTPNSAARIVTVSPEQRRLRIEQTSWLESFADQCASPIRDLAGCDSPDGNVPLLRPLAALSRLLSAGDPRNKCAGFTQPGLSHRWQITFPSGICPCICCQAKR